MAFKRRFFQGNVEEKVADCSCGGKVKLGSRKNFPFGTKSRSITTWFYKCKSCKKTTFVNKKSGGKR